MNNKQKRPERCVGALPAYAWQAIAAVKDYYFEQSLTDFYLSSALEQKHHIHHFMRIADVWCDYAISQGWHEDDTSEG